MRKNLHYKVLASVLAICALNYALPNNALANDYEVQTNNETVTGIYEIVDGNGYKFTFEGQATNIYGVDKSSSSGDAEDANGANVTINNSLITTFVYGGYSYSMDGNSGNAIGNYVTINNSQNDPLKVYGGYSYGYITSGNAADNHVTINNNSTAHEVFGGYSKSDMSNCGDVTGNYVTINNSTVNYVYGGYSDKGNVTDNHVIITDSIINNNIYAGFIIGNQNTNSEIKDNSVTIKGNTDITKANIYGSFLGSTNTNVTIGNNTLILDGWSGTTKNIFNFQNIEFKNVSLTNNPVLNLNNTNTTDLNDIENITINNFAGGQRFTEGDTFTLISNASKGAITEQNFNTTAGITADVGGVVEQNGNDVVMKVNSVQLNGQTKLVAQTRAASAAFVNQGTDLISDSLDTLSRDGSYGVKTFAAVHGNRSKYDVNSDLKINGWSTIVGVGNASEFTDGDEFSWGVFYENGSGNYRTYNEFNNEFFRGDGSLVYNGGGIAARYENNNGVYTEGSLRAGMLKSDMDNALRDGSGNYYGYDSESAYYGAHIGVGKIISLSDSSDLDVYGKFFHTYTEGDSFTVANDKFEFDSINSDRLRVGARVTTNKANKFSTYYGLAYEYEFNGDADMRAQNLAAPTQSLQGSSYMAELGFNYQPTPDSPWSFDLNQRGYAGEREGGSFNVQATYTF